MGSKLGPHLFLLYLNGLYDALYCSRLLFAEDIKLHNNISAQQDSLYHQNELNKLSEWYIKH